MSDVTSYTFVVNKVNINIEETYNITSTIDYIHNIDETIKFAIVETYYQNLRITLVGYDYSIISVHTYTMPNGSSGNYTRRAIYDRENKDIYIGRVGFSDYYQTVQHCYLVKFDIDNRSFSRIYVYNDPNASNLVPFRLHRTYLLEDWWIMTAMEPTNAIIKYGRRGVDPIGEGSLFVTPDDTWLDDRNDIWPFNGYVMVLSRSQNKILLLDLVNQNIQYADLPDSSAFDISQGVIGYSTYVQYTANDDFYTVYIKDITNNVEYRNEPLYLPVMVLQSKAKPYQWFIWTGGVQNLVLIKENYNGSTTPIDIPDYYFIEIANMKYNVEDHNFQYYLLYPKDGQGIRESLNGMFNTSNPVRFNSYLGRLTYYAKYPSSTHSIYTLHTKQIKFSIDNNGGLEKFFYHVGYISDILQTKIPDIENFDFSYYTVDIYGYFIIANSTIDERVYIIKIPDHHDETNIFYGYPDIVYPIHLFYDLNIINAKYLSVFTKRYTNQAGPSFVVASYGEDTNRSIYMFDLYQTVLHKVTRPGIPIECVYEPIIYHIKKEKKIEFPDLMQYIDEEKTPLDKRPHASIECQWERKIYHKKESHKIDLADLIQYIDEEKTPLDKRPHNSIKCVIIEYTNKDYHMPYTDVSKFITFANLMQYATQDEDSCPPIDVKPVTLLQYATQDEDSCPPIDIEFANLMQYATQDEDSCPPIDVKPVTLLQYATEDEDSCPPIDIEFADLTQYATEDEDSCPPIDIEFANLTQYATEDEDSCPPIDIEFADLMQYATQDEDSCPPIDIEFADLMQYATEDEDSCPPIDIEFANLTQYVDIEKTPFEIKPKNTIKCTVLEYTNKDYKMPYTDVSKYLTLNLLQYATQDEDSCPPIDMDIRISQYSVFNTKEPVRFTFSDLMQYATEENCPPISIEFANLIQHATEDNCPPIDIEFADLMQYVHPSINFDVYVLQHATEDNCPPIYTDIFVSQYATEDSCPPVKLENCGGIQFLFVQSFRKIEVEICKAILIDLKLVVNISGKPIYNLPHIKVLPKDSAFYFLDEYFEIYQELKDRFWIRNYYSKNGIKNVMNAEGSLDIYDVQKTIVLNDYRDLKENKIKTINILDKWQFEQLIK